ncbi:hypothetical protein JAAARDRAFT_61245 [Jaapia argillacea MUCL 33604]|uniref:SMP-30/Gluconolactonase/LRE-like region domain-containing protein n=1 Tax=Jaapia argillacea MUCL 33604 TaxID=933084 RepID=A0A067PI72_9AGAM|nr:hypothetical protein JAAARDRAFT_61245 [Jaapia argillacea MUCL 33604]
MARIFFSVLAVVVAVVFGFYQLRLKPLFNVAGVGRVLEPKGNTNCKAVPQLQACEKIILHAPSGLLYLACSTPSSRTHWTPAVLRLNETGMSQSDYVATYNPDTGKITRLTVLGFTSLRGLSLHGMDVVPSSSNPNELWVYLINHRKPLGGAKASEVGADSVIEIFKTVVGGTSLTHVTTVEDPVILTPNDVVGSPTGKSFHFSNDHGAKTGISRTIELYLTWPRSSVGFCHLDKGCKIAIGKLPGINGITKAKNDTFYVPSAGVPELRVLERQADDTLVVTDIIPTDRLMDNASVDEDGIVWAAGFPDALQMVGEHFEDPTIPSPSSALAFSLNTGKDAYFGQKFKVEKVFEDDGNVASGTTTVVHDPRRGLLFLTGVCSPHLTVCNVRQ